MAEKGRAATWRGYGNPIVIEEFDVPDPEPGAILVKITLGGICGSDLHGWRGDNRGAPPRPGVTGGTRTMGHEMTGIVAKLGAGVTTDSLGRPLKEGDRLCYMQLFPCYHCYMCSRGEYNVCPNRKFGGGPAGEFPYFTGAFGDYFYLPPRHWAWKTPDELPDEVIVPVNCAMGTVTQGLTTVGVHEGDYIVIQGVGGLGLSAAAMARDMGADKIIAIDQQEKRLELAVEFGATDTININEFDSPEARVARVREITRLHGGADMVVEVAGIPALLLEGVEMLNQLGTFLEIGNLVPGTVDFAPRSLLGGRGKRIVGTAMYKPSILPRILDFLIRNQGRYPFDKLVSHKFALADINEAFEQAEWTNRQTNVVRACVVP